MTGACQNRASEATFSSAASRQIRPALRGQRTTIVVAPEVHLCTVARNSVRYSDKFLERRIRLSALGKDITCGPRPPLSSATAVRFLSRHRGSPEPVECVSELALDFWIGGYLVLFLPRPPKVVDRGRSLSVQEAKAASP